MVDKEYFAFISYKSEDVEWATWLQHELEHYHLPASFNGRTDVPQELRPVFRDIDELSAGNLPEQIKQALENSQNLIVICSPQSAKSPWVNQEVETFIALGRTNGIFPFIVEGNSPSEFFPPALLHLPKKDERLGGDVSKKGRDAAFVKVVAGMLEVDFDSLWNRYEKEKAEEERKQREQRDRLLISQSRFLAEKANALVEEGDSYTARLLLMEATATPTHPDHPYTIEAERAFRNAISHNSAIFTGHIRAVQTAMYSHDGRMIVSASSDNTIKIWDSRTGNCMKTLQGHEASATYATFSYNDRIIASASWDKTIRLWDSQSGECFSVLERHAKDVRYVTFSHNDNMLVIVGTYYNPLSASSDNNAIIICDISTRQIRHTLYHHRNKVNCVAFSNNDDIIASASDDQTICLFESKTGNVVARLEGHKESVNHLEFISNTDELVSFGNSEIIFWNILTKQLLKRIKTEKEFTFAAYNNERKMIAAVVNNDVNIWDKESEKLLQVIQTHLPYPESVSYLHFSPNGRNVVLAITDDTIRQHDVCPNNNLVLEGHKDFVTNTCFSPDGKLIASSSEHMDRTIRIWDVRSGDCLNILTGHTSRIKSVTFSPDGKMIASASHDGSIRFWGLDGTVLFRFEGQGGFNSISFSPDGLYAASSQDGKICLWDVLGRKCIRAVEGSIYDLSNCISYSMDGETIAAAWGNNILILNAHNGEPIRMMENHDDFIFSVAYSHNGKRIVSTSRDKTIKIWDAKTGECMFTFKHNYDVTSAKYSPDDKIIASSSWDGTIRIWNASDGICLQKTFLSTSAFSVSFNAQGNKIAISASEKVVVLEYPSLDDIITQTYNRFKNRQLTPEERRRFYLE